MKNYLLIKADGEEIFLAIYEDQNKLSERIWKPGRELSNQINSGINEICKKVRLTIFDLNGIIVYEGPGSYTGLRISISVANALAYSLDIPILGLTGDDWINEGLREIRKINQFTPVVPKYGGEVYTTKPKK